VARRWTVKDVLQAALSRLQVYGWVQWDTGNRKVGYCMTGAIYASTRNGSLRLGAIDALNAAVTKRDPHLLEGVTFPATRVQCFNDQDRRRKSTIISIYHQAIKGSR